MSWFRSALSIGAEAANASGKAVGSGFERASSFASSVVQRANDAVLLAGDAVEQGAKMVYEHAEHAVGGASARQHNSFRHAVRRIEEVAMLARGAERKEALARWLGALAEISAERDQAERGEKELAALQQLGMGLALGGSAAAGGGSDGGGGSGKNDSADGGAGEAAGQRAAEADGGGGQAGEGAEEGGGEGAGKGAGESDGTSGSGVREGLAPPSASPRRLPAPPSVPPHSKVSRVLFHDPNAPHQPLTFRDVFLHSQALENMVASLVMDPGDDEEFWLLRNLFRCPPSLLHPPSPFLLSLPSFLRSLSSSLLPLHAMLRGLISDCSFGAIQWRHCIVQSPLPASTASTTRSPSNQATLQWPPVLCLSHRPRKPSPAPSLLSPPLLCAHEQLSGDELERFVAEAMTGLKVSPEAERLDAEARRLEHAVAQGLAAVHASSALHAAEDDGDRGKGGGAEGKGKGEEVGEEGAEQAEGEGGAGEAESAEGEAALGRVEEAERAVDEVLAVQQHEVQAARSREVLRAALRLVALERRREALLQQGDTPGDRALKVERVTSLAAELGEGVVALRAQMAECSQQKADALAYRTAKAQEAADSHSVVDREMAALQARKAELEEELSKVQSAIDSLSKKQGKVREEKEQFSMASTSIVTHLAAQVTRWCRPPPLPPPFLLLMADDSTPLELGATDKLELLHDTTAVNWASFEDTLHTHLGSVIIQDYCLVLEHPNGIPPVLPLPLEPPPPDAPPPTEPLPDPPRAPVHDDNPDRRGANLNAYHKLRDTYTLQCEAYRVAEEAHANANARILSYAQDEKDYAEELRKIHKDVAAWRVADRRALAIIFSCIPSHLKRDLRPTSSSELWKTLSTQYDRQDLRSLLPLFRNFQDITLDSSPTAAAYTRRLIDTAQRLNDRGIVISESLLTARILDCLPPTYDTYRITFTSRHRDPPPVADTIEWLLDSELPQATTTAEEVAAQVCPAVVVVDVVVGEEEDVVVAEVVAVVGVADIPHPRAPSPRHLLPSSTPTPTPPPTPPPQAPPLHYPPPYVGWPYPPYPPRGYGYGPTAPAANLAEQPSSSSNPPDFTPFASARFIGHPHTLSSGMQAH
ncbi:unnamed protein product [Closterium sp. NIES-53]